MSVKKIIIVLFIVFSCLTVVGCGFNKKAYYNHMNSDMDIFIKKIKRDDYYDNMKLVSSYSGVGNMYYDVIWESKNEYMEIVDNVLKIKKYPVNETEVTLKVTFNEVIYEDKVKDRTISREFNIKMYSKKQSLIFNFAQKNNFFIDSEWKTMSKTKSSSAYDSGTPYKYQYEIDINNLIINMSSTSYRYTGFSYEDHYIECTYNPKIGNIKYKEYWSGELPSEAETYTINLKGMTKDEIKKEISSFMEYGINYIDEYLDLIGESQYCSSLYKK